MIKLIDPKDLGNFYDMRIFWKKTQFDTGKTLTLEFKFTESYISKTAYIKANM